MSETIEQFKERVLEALLSETQLGLAAFKLRQELADELTEQSIIQMAAQDSITKNRDLLRMLEDSNK